MKVTLKLIIAKDKIDLEDSVIEEIIKILK